MCWHPVFAPLLKRSGDLFWVIMNYDYQLPHIDRLVSILRKQRVAVDGSDTGTGKTYVALNVARKMGLYPVVICPKGVISQWEDALDDLNMKGYVNNYESYKRLKTPYIANTGKKRVPFRWIDCNNVLLIFDEVHRAGRIQTADGKLIVAATQSNIVRLLASATIGENPLKMEAIGLTLRLYQDKSGYYDWAMKRGVVRNPYGFGSGLEYRPTKTDILRIHSDIFGRRGSRITWDQVGIELVNKIIPLKTELDTKAINKAYDNIRRIQKQIEDRELDDEPAAIVEILRARQKIEASRVGYLYEQITDLVNNSNHSIIVFLNFRESIKELYRMLQPLPVSIIDGMQNSKQRRENVNGFQFGCIRVILSQIQAGGTGLNLHDTTGDRPRVVYLSPTYDARTMIQATGRAPRAGSKSATVQYIVCAKGTFEEKVYKNMKQKQDRINIINDGDLNPE